jgi:flagellar motor protein MotB
MAFQDQIESTHAEGDNYFVSMTDMMVGLLFVFIIMLMTFALSYRQREDISQDDIDRLRKAVEVVDQKIEDLKKVYQTRAQFLEDMKTRLIAVGVQVKVDPATGVLRLGEGVLFDSESATIKQPTGPINIRKIGIVLDDLLPCYLGSISQRRSTCRRVDEVTLESIFLEGHADSSGDVKKNWDLSVNRAIATYRELEYQIPQVTKLKNSSGEHLFSVSGYGHFRSVDTNDTPIGRAANRRIDLRFNMQLDQQRALDQIRTELRRVLDRQ